jgi:hypothetical protein
LNWGPLGPELRVAFQQQIADDRQSRMNTSESGDNSILAPHLLTAAD